MTACCRLIWLTVQRGTVSPSSACEAMTTAAAWSGGPAAKGSRSRLSVSRNSAAIITGPRPQRRVSGPASIAPMKLSGPIAASDTPSRAGGSASSRVA